MVLEPALVDFGELPCGSSATETVLVRNDGAGALEVASVSVEGAEAYSVEGPTPPFLVEAGEHVELKVGFSAMVDAGGWLSVRGDDPSNPEARVELVGTCEGPQLALDPEFVDFGVLLDLCLEGEATVLVQSVGTMPVDVSAVTVDGEAYLLRDPPSVPFLLEPGDMIPLNLTFAPLTEGDSEGTLTVASSDPSGDMSAALEGSALGEVCELTFEVRVPAVYHSADIALLLDTTCSMSSTATSLAMGFETVAGDLAASYPDLTFGLGTFDDYNYGTFGSGLDKPFILRQQQTDDTARLAGVLAGIEIHSGADGPESGHEALVQAATGQGYDQGCDGAFESRDDVRPFLSSPLDAFAGLELGAGDLSGLGTVGGMGFREGVLPIFVLATDNELRDPGAGYDSPGGCLFDATSPDAVAAMAALDGRFIGIAANMWGEQGRIQMETLAEETGTFADMDGDLVSLPAVFEWLGSPAELVDLLVRGIDAVLADESFDKVTVEVAEDPHGVVVALSPSEFFGVDAGDEVVFDVTVEGELVEHAGPSTREATVRLVGNDRTLIRHYTLFVAR
jgi:hypothetical protein